MRKEVVSYYICPNVSNVWLLLQIVNICGYKCVHIYIRSEMGHLRTTIIIVVIELIILMSIKLNGNYDDKED